MARVTSGLPGAGYEGKFGNAVFYRVGDETLMRERIVPANPRTGLQTLSRLAFGRASQGWSALSNADFAAWEAAGGHPVYMSLTRKWLAVHPGGVPPTTPPAGPFFGDAVTLSLPLGRDRGGVESLAEAGKHPHPALPQGGGDSPRLVLTANQPNAQGVVTEILVQPLANARRKPRSRDWKTAAFLTFASGSLTQSLPLSKGAYAVAYRFVNAATGQATARATLGNVAVG